MQEMSTNLTKGSRFNLSQKFPQVNQIAVQLIWEIQDKTFDNQMLSLGFMLGENRLIPTKEFLVSDQNSQSADGAVTLSKIATKQNQVTYVIDLSRVSSDIQEILFTINLPGDSDKKITFSQVTKVTMTGRDLVGEAEIFNYEIKEHFKKELAIEIARLYRKNGEWRLQAIGHGYGEGLSHLLQKYYDQNLTETEFLSRFPQKLSSVTESLTRGRKLNQNQPISSSSSGKLTDDLDLPDSFEFSENPPPSRIANRVKQPSQNLSRNRPIDQPSQQFSPLQIKGLLGGIVGITVGVFCLGKFQDFVLHKAQVLQRETTNIKQTDAPYLRNLQNRLNDSIAWLKKVPNFPGFAYQKSQTYIGEFQNKLQEIDGNLPIATKLETAQNLAMSASTLVQNPPHPLETWYQAKTQWEQSLSLLSSIPKQTSYGIIAQQKIPNYQANLATVNRYFKIAEEAVLFNNKAVMKVQQKDYQGAIIDFQHAIKLNPKFAQAYHGLGNTYYQLGDPQQAFQQYNEALKVDGKFADAYFSRGTLYNKFGQKLEAVSDYDRSIEYQPNYAEAHFARGVIHYQFNRKYDAIEDLEKAVNLFLQKNDLVNHKIALDLLNKIRASLPEPVVCDYENRIDSLGNPCGWNRRYVWKTEPKPKYDAPIYRPNKPVITPKSSDDDDDSGWGRRSRRSRRRR